MDEDEMTFEQLRAAMLAGIEAEVRPGPLPVLADHPGTPINFSLALHITRSNFDVTTGPERHGASQIGRPVKLVAIRRPMLLHAH
jgi:hypothetical protein